MSRREGTPFSEEFFGEPGSPFIDKMSPLSAAGLNGDRVAGMRLGETTPNFLVRGRGKKPPLIEFGISFATEGKKHGKGQRADFWECRQFMREALSSFGEEESIQLIHFLSHYMVRRLYKTGVAPEEAKPLSERQRDFARLSITILKGTLGERRNFSQIASSLPIGKLLGLPEEFFTPESRLTFVKSTFYFWAALMAKLFPCSRLALTESFKKGYTCRMADKGAELALSKAATALAICHQIVENRQVLSASGISSLHQELWFRALVAAPPKGYKQTREDILAEENFRNDMLTTASMTSLEGVRIRWLLSQIPQGQRAAAVVGFMNELIDFINKKKATVGIKAERQSRVNAVGWFRQRSEREKGQIAKALIARRGRGPIEGVLAGRHYKPSVRFGGSREYPGRERLRSVLGPMFEMIVERLEGRSATEIFTPAEPSKKAAFSLYQQAEANFYARQDFFNPTILAALDRIKIKLAINGTRLTNREILTLLLVASKKGFSSNVFLPNFRMVFKEYLPLYDDNEKG